MNSVEVKKSELLEVVKKNRDNHRAVFLKAQEGYRKAVIKELDDMLEQARKGDKIKRAVTLEAPHDHTGEYDEVIAMLEMSVDNLIELQRQEFNQYVLDKWSWSEYDFANKTAYLAHTV